jgi:hypothetical protein
MENGGALQVIVTRDTVLPMNTTVQYATRDGSALHSLQYTTTRGTLSFTGLVNTGTITIPIIDNDLPNGNTQFFIDLSNPTGETTIDTPEAPATIQDNEFPSFFKFAGKFNGIIGSNPATNANAGFVSLSMNRNGIFTASIQYGGLNYHLKGRFDAYGDLVNLPIPNSIPSLSLTLHLDMVNGSNSITGSITDGVTTASITADQAVFDAKRFPAPQKGLFTFLIPPDSLMKGNDVPQGFGYGTIKVNGNGSGRFVGALGEGTKVTQSLHLSKGGSWPLYVSVYKQQGSISGAIQFRDVPGSSNLDGKLMWFKPPIGGNLYPWGFTLHPTLVGSSYILKKGTRVLSYRDSSGNASFTISAGGVTPSTAKTILTWLSNNKVITATSEPFKMTISASSGLFTGSFTDSTGKTNTFNGALLQTPNIGAGWFLGNGLTGGVKIQQNILAQ